MARSFAEVMAELMPTREPAKCPKCGGRILAGVTIYADMPVVIVSSLGVKRAEVTGKLIQTKAQLQDQVDRAYVGSRIEVRDDLYCEHYDIGEEGCDFWTHAVELES
jgi:hypothetical protein